MRKKLAMALSIVLALCLIAIPALAAGSTATPETWSDAAVTDWYKADEASTTTEYTISSAEQLAGLAKLVNEGNTFGGKTIKLGENIDLEGKEWTPIGNATTAFNGTFDGGSKTISNLVITRGTQNIAANNGTGLFGRIGTSGVIQNVKVNNATITGSLFVGAILGGEQWGGGQVKDCTLTGNVQITGYWYVGGIAGRIAYGKDITNCTVQANSGSYIKALEDTDGAYVGGILGFHESVAASIANCKVSGVSISGNDRVGGIVGILHTQNTILNCSVENISVASKLDQGNTGLIAGANQGSGNNNTIPKMFNCSADAASTITAAGSPIESRPLLGECNNAGEPAKGAIVGTGVVFDENGKITAGEIELVGSTPFEASNLFAEETTATVKGGELTDEGKLVTYVAEVGDKGYATLDEALTAAKGDDNTVTLLKNIALSAAVNISDSVTIDGNGYSFTRASGYTGTFFTVAENATLKLDNVHIDAGGKWSINEEKWEADKAISLNNLSVYDGKNWENGAADPITVNSGNVTTNANLITLNGNSNLTMTGGTIIENIYATTNVHVIGVGGTDNTINIEDATIKHFAGTGGSLMITTNGSGSKTITLGSKAVLTDNYNLSGNGGLFYLNSTDTLTMAEGAEVTNNRGVNCNGTFIMTRSGATFTMNGGLISKNVGLKGGSNGYCQPVYAHVSGSFIMNGGEITDNTGCYVGAVYQRIDNSADQSSTGKVTLTGGKIYNNHYYGEDEGALTESSLGQVFITDEATIGDGMTITGDVSFYGQSKATVEGTIDGNVHIFAEQYVEGVTENNVELKGTITGNVIVENGAKATNSGTIQGNVTVEPQDEEDDNHSNGDFVNTDDGTITGTVTLTGGASVQLDDSEDDPASVTAGANGAKFTVDDDTVTLTEGTLTAANCGDINFRDTANNVLEPADGKGNGKVMIVVARVTHGEELRESFDNFADAVAEAVRLSENGGTYTVTLLKDAEGVGIDIAPTSGTSPSIVIDFNGHTYTLTGSPVGSANTKTQGMRIQKGATVTIKNGTLAVTEDNGTFEQNFLWLINNYGDLTVENMTLDGTNLVMPSDEAIYTLNSNYGKVSITKTTFIDSNSQADGEVYSMRALYSASSAYGGVSQITIDDESVFNKVFVARSAENTREFDGMMVYVEYNDVKYGIDATDKTADSYIVFAKDGDKLTPVLPDANLNYSAIADPSIVENCAAQTMWVLFKETLPENTWLWFEITDADGNVYGIAGKAEAATTKMAWSFLNEGQFESWPDEVTGVADGEATVNCYVLPGKVTTAPAEGAPMYLAWTKTVNVSNVTAYVPEPEVTVGENVAQNDRQTVTDAAVNTAIDEAHMNDLASEALTDAENELPTTEEAKKALEDDENVSVTDGDTVHIVVETYLEIEVKEYVTEGNDKKLTFDIQPMYQVVATTAESVNEIEIGENAVTIGDAHPLPVPANTSVTMTLGVPEGFLDADATVYVMHVKNGRTYYYRAQVNDDDTITFTNPHGFSPFTVIVKAPEAQAEIGDTLYDTLQDALDHVQDGETIEVLTSDALTATAPAKEISFEIVAGEGVDDIDVTVSDNGNYHVTVDGNTYTVKYVAPVSPSRPAETTAKVEETEGGTVTLSSTTAKAGETVTATLTPDEGMKADGLTVTDADGSEVAVTENEDGTYSFVMPAATPVTVKGAFVEDCPADLFPDIDVTEWYHDYADYVIDNGIMNGYEDGTFKPHDVLTRAELATVLWNLSGQKDAGEDVLTFTDVKEGDWFYAAVQWASGEGIVNGYEDGSFKPDQAVTREELAVMLYRYAESIGEEADPEYTIPATYTDAATIGDWALEAMSWCVQNGIINGRTATTIEPGATAERCEVAAMLTRYLRPAE